MTVHHLPKPIPDGDPNHQSKNLCVPGKSALPSPSLHHAALQRKPASGPDISLPAQLDSGCHCPRVVPTEQQVPGMGSSLVCGCSFYFLKAEPVPCWHKQWILAQHPRSFLGTGIPPCLEKHISCPEGSGTQAAVRALPSFVPVPITLLFSSTPHPACMCPTHPTCATVCSSPRIHPVRLIFQRHSVCPPISLSSPASQPQLMPFTTQNQLHLERQAT